MPRSFHKNIPQKYISRFCILLIIWSFLWHKMYSSMLLMIFFFQIWWFYLSGVSLVESLPLVPVAREDFTGTESWPRFHTSAPQLPTPLSPCLKMAPVYPSSVTTQRKSFNFIQEIFFFDSSILIYFQEYHVTYLVFFSLVCSFLWGFFYGYVLWDSSTIFEFMGTYQIITHLYYFDGGFFLRVL